MKTFTDDEMNALLHEAVMPVVLLVIDGSDVSGIGVFTGTVDETVAAMNDDPGVRAGVFSFEVHACRGFLGDALP